MRAAPITAPAIPPVPPVRLTPPALLGEALAAVDVSEALAPPEAAVDDEAVVLLEVTLLVVEELLVDESAFPTNPTPNALVEAPSSAQTRPDMTCSMNVSFCHAKIYVSLSGELGIRGKTSVWGKGRGTDWC